LSWRDLRRRLNAGIACWTKLEITPPSISNHPRYGTTIGINGYSITSSARASSIGRHVEAERLRGRQTELAVCPKRLLLILEGTSNDSQWAR
jgi:hypothetical protein